MSGENKYERAQRIYERAHIFERPSKNHERLFPNHARKHYRVIGLSWCSKHP